MPVLEQIDSGMDRATFDRFRKIVHEKSGISLGPGKEALVCARVGKRMRTLGIRDHRTYLRHVMHDDSGEEVVQLLDAISTNVTSFFREPRHFDFIGQVVSEWFSKGQRRFRFWSAACSTGEEPYSLAMTLLEQLDGRSADTRILATDISTRVLEKCRIGTYTPDRLEPVPQVLRDRYFERRRGEGGILYAAKSALKRMIVFKRINLSTPPFLMRGPLDVILCRNVMIYFDNRVRRDLLADMYRLLKSGGYLMVGHAESLSGVVSDLKAVEPSIYMKE